ncbi:hypothetical protein DYB28_002281 [Aphanomyces astaci]|uniref:SGTA homodimerisation domain-containing protein n=1 Tax=Aphanomyces astaci TaxID=112090 RepID=A0A9X8HEF5_APHAT|nr:hypothetical protein DYB28_002281 [Aphanomyces astaci]
MGGITEAEKVLLFSVLEFLAPLSGKDGVDAAKVQAGVKSLQYVNMPPKALSKFKEKFGSDKAPPSLSKEEKEAKAETLKASGNAALSAKDYAKAEQLYSEAIALSPAGPNSHIYLSNLAAAQMYLEKYDDVVDNCEKSIELNPKYVKAYSRLGAAYLQLEDIDLAIDAFSRGLEVDPTNDMCKSGLHDARNRQSHLQTRNAPPPAGGGGMPDLSALAGMMGGAGGGAGGLAGLMSNPAMQQMAAQMMQNPQMMAMYNHHHHMDYDGRQTV